jgi:hypothetical protein
VKNLWCKARVIPAFSFIKTYVSINKKLLNLRLNKNVTKKNVVSGVGGIDSFNWYINLY